MGFGKNITLSRSYSSETRSLWVKITFSMASILISSSDHREEPTHMTPYHKWSPAWPVLSLQKETAASFHHKPTALRFISIKPGSQCHPSVHTWAQIKISPLTSCAQTQLSLEVSFQSPLPVLMAALQSSRGAGESLSSGGRKRRSMCHKIPGRLAPALYPSILPWSPAPGPGFIIPERMERYEEKINSK